jgi:hypothetical protein
MHEMLPTLPLGVYRHYKGPLYEVLGLARHSENEAQFVVYKTLYDHSGWWLRPLAMFQETVVVQGLHKPRFEYLENYRHPKK